MTHSYYSSPHITPPNHVHSVISPQSQDPATKGKRPKYTRSKTGCLTCRVKKIKCDEAKPICGRCDHSQRECTWPEGVPIRKKPTPKVEPNERPGTAGSSGMSEGSTPPARDPTPPKRSTLDLGLPPLESRRRNEPVLQLHSISHFHDQERRHQGFNDRIASHGYPSFHSTTTSNILPMIPDVSPYPAQHRFDHSYPSSRTTSGYHVSNHRPLSHHHQLNQWNQSMLSPDHVDPYYHNLQDRSLIGHSSHHGHHARYQ